jgi:hypothetical protein
VSRFASFISENEVQQIENQNKNENLSRLQTKKHKRGQKMKKK